VEARIRQVTPYIRSERLAISPQCGFTSAEANKPLPVAE
jgi:methionine synthase II (cobalamin-independent)